MKYKCVVYPGFEPDHTWLRQVLLFVDEVHRINRSALSSCVNKAKNKDSSVLVDQRHFNPGRSSSILSVHIQWTKGYIANSPRVPLTVVVEELNKVAERENWPQVSYWALKRAIGNQDTDEMSVLATNGLIECLLQIKKRMELKGKSFGLILGEEVPDEQANQWQSRIPDTIAQANFALSGLDLSGLMGYMGKVFPESRPFIAGFKRGDGKYMEAAHELFEYTRGRTDVLDNLIRTVKIFFPEKDLTLEVLSGARAILVQPSLLLIPHGIVPDRE